MIHEVKVFSADGELKEVIPSTKLTKQFWNEFYGIVNVYKKQQQVRYGQHGTGPIFEDGEEELYEPGAFE